MAIGTSSKVGVMCQEVIRSYFLLSLYKYLLVGGINTGIVWGSIYAFSEWAYSPMPVAVTCAYIVSISFQFFTNRTFTFSSSGAIRVEFKRYMILFCTNYVMTLGVMYLITEVLHFSLLLGMVASAVVTVPISYLVSYFWVYNVENRIFCSLKKATLERRKP